MLLKVFFPLVGLFVIFTIINDTVFFRAWTQGGRLILEPSPNLLATAEYLYINPIPTPKEIDKIDINPEGNGVCIITGERIIGGDNLFTRWFLNGERVPYNTYRQFSYNEDYGVNYCMGIYGLPIGFHLLEIQVNGSPFYTAMSYQFAIKIEPSPTPSPTPPTP
jgi:hypothetical protein